ncbi:MAG: ABC transporter permease [Candidatus Aminicenantes bacterium]|nr:ABC transporter permease [Candidatus Aminicenantes bacterium]
MFKNYLKMAFRSLKRQKSYSLINIFGLAVGIACCLFITLWVLDELSFDRFHEHADLLYRVEFDQDYSGEMFHVNVTPHPLAPEIKSEIPEIEEAARLNRMEEILVQVGDKRFIESRTAAVDPSFLSMFSFPLVKGEPSTALSSPQSLVISEDTARKYFGDTNPIGKTMTVNTDRDFTVTGVFQNMPSNSTIKFDMAFPYALLQVLDRNLENWQNNSITTYVKLAELSSHERIGEKIEAVIKKHTDTLNQTYFIRPVTDIHLKSTFGFGNNRGETQYVAIFSIIAIFVLLIACINFINLTTARSAKRALEVGMRKVVGAVKSQIIRQFYTEACLFTFFALFLSLGLVVLLLPSFNNLSGKEISLEILAHGPMPLFLIGIALITGILSGSYPALFLSSFQPTKVFRGPQSHGSQKKLFRRTLVIVQFALSIGLIIGTGIVTRQLEFIKNKNLGFEKEHLLTIPMRAGLRETYSAFKKELLQSPDIAAVSAAEYQPFFIAGNFAGADWEGKDPEQSISFSFCGVDFDYIEATGIKMKEGRSFSREFSSDADSAVIVNETALEVMGMESAVGKRFSLDEDDPRKIIGVVNDFHFLSMHKKIEPLVLFIGTGRLERVLIRVHGVSVDKALSFIEKTWNRLLPQYPFEYNFMNQYYDTLYRSEQRMEALLKVFSILAIFIACLGLLGLASYAAEQRTKEIGIRKALGASPGQVGALLCREFFFLVLAANLFAWPVTYLAMHSWLQNFAYRAPMHWGLFVLAAGLALAVALAAVGYQAVKAASANPVKALRYE